MSMTLNLVHRLLAMGRKYQVIGRTHEAFQILNRLVGFKALPSQIAEEAQFRLARISLKRRNYRRARRHLTAALLHAPQNPRYHYLMARAVNKDDQADPRRAADHFRQSLQANPDQPRCLSHWGLLALRLGQSEEGLRSLRRAVELSPDNPAVVSKLAAGLGDLGQVDEARQVLRTALFRNARDLRFRKLWTDFQFLELRRSQKDSSRHASADDAQEPVYLPFISPTQDEARSPEKVSRRDEKSNLPSPHLFKLGKVADHKNARINPAE